jgi:hypothetical protein
MRSWTKCAAFAGAVVLAACLPVFADSVPVIGGTDTAVGLEGRQGISPPADGFTDPSAQSSNTGVATVEQPTSGMAGQGFEFKTTGKGVTVVTITWTNPKTKEVKKQFYVIAVGVKCFPGTGMSTYSLRVGDTAFQAAPKGFYTSDDSVVGKDGDGDNAKVKAKGEGAAVIIYDDGTGACKVQTYYVEKAKPATTTTTTPSAPANPPGNPGQEKPGSN